MYLAIAAGVMHRGGSGAILVWMLLAGISTAAQAQMYDYHRQDYAMIAVKGLVPGGDPANITLAWMKPLYAGYLATARVLNGLHAEVDSVIAARSTAGVVREDDRALYRKCFYGPVRGWNLLGDNMRRFAIGGLVCLDRLDLFFAFVLVPMNAVLIAMWFWQRKRGPQIPRQLVIRLIGLDAARSRPENVVPERRTHTVPAVIVFVMMTHVILLQPEPHAPFH